MIVSAASLFALLASVASAYPAICPATSAPAVAVQQDQSSQSQTQMCTPEMLQGFRILAPVNFNASASDASGQLPTGGQYVDATNTTILLTQSPQTNGSNATEGQDAIQVKFTDDTAVSTRLLQNSAFAISWNLNASQAGGSGQGGQQTQQNASSDQSQSGASQMQIVPIRVQLVDTQGKLSNVSGTLGVLNLANSSQQTGSGGDQSQTMQGGNASQSGETSQSEDSASQQPSQGGNTSDSSTSDQEDQGGAIVVFLGDEIDPGLYSFLVTTRVSSGQQSSNVTCRLLTSPFRLSAVSDLSEGQQAQQPSASTSPAPSGQGQPSSGGQSQPSSSGQGQPSSGGQGQQSSGGQGQQSSGDQTQQGGQSSGGQTQQSPTSSGGGAAQPTSGGEQPQGQ